MSNTLFQTEEDINNDWLFYIENEAKSLAQRDDFAIQNYLDRELFNPEMQSYLESNNTVSILDSVSESETLHLNLIEGLKANILPEKFRTRFRKLKTKVKQIFCEVVHSASGLDTQGIIKAVLLALIPAFASGLPAAILPILIGLIAYLIKYGIEKTCPV